jgi:coatomer subunit beta'
VQRLDVALTEAQALDSPLAWKRLAHVATERGQLALAETCHVHCKDHSALLLLHTAAGQRAQLAELAVSAQQQTNVAFVSLLLCGDVNGCLELLLGTNRLAEAAMFARSYCPSRASDIVKRWKADLALVIANFLGFYLWVVRGLTSPSGGCPDQSEGGAGAGRPGRISEFV